MRAWGLRRLLCCKLNSLSIHLYICEGNPRFLSEIMRIQSFKEILWKCSLFTVKLNKFDQQSTKISIIKLDVFVFKNFFENF